MFAGKQYYVNTTLSYAFIRITSTFKNKSSKKYKKITKHEEVQKIVMITSWYN